MIFMVASFPDDVVAVRWDRPDSPAVRDRHGRSGAEKLDG
jgi:hypothetical protein